MVGDPIQHFGEPRLRVDVVYLRGGFETPDEFYSLLGTRPITRSTRSSETDGEKVLSAAVGSGSDSAEALEAAAQTEGDIRLTRSAITQQNERSLTTLPSTK